MNYREEKGLEYLKENGFHNISISEVTKNKLTYALYRHIDMIVAKIIDDVEIKTEITEDKDLKDTYNLTTRISLK